MNYNRVKDGYNIASILCRKVLHSRVETKVSRNIKDVIKSKYN
ncbi:MAG: hypothetical protein ACI8ZM_004768 [Crocinitomix sp.]|jgi:hypothetical protein